MKSFLRHRARRFEYDGWAVQYIDESRPLYWTVSTTREEARAIRRAMAPELFRRTKITKVLIEVIPA